jgi:uncharacterized membrane protein
MTGTGAALFAAVFLACTVEAVEAVTIVLAAGTARRSWRSASYGVLSGLAALAVIVAVVGPAVTVIPLDPLRLIVGGLLLIFGLQWLRKAILRASGHKDLHDEEAIFARELAAANAAETGSRWAVPDWYAFTLSFKGVLLEGLEVVFIVLTFGANDHDIPLAALAALVAVALVSVLGFAIKAPLAKVPENTLKFVVGIMLTSFGVFWGAEGARAHWPGSDAALLVIAPAVAAFALALVAALRRSTPNPTPPAAPTPNSNAGPPPPCAPWSTDHANPEPTAARIRRVLVRLRDRRRLARGCSRRARPRPDLRRERKHDPSLVDHAGRSGGHPAGQPLASPPPLS